MNPLLMQDGKSGHCEMCTSGWEQPLSRGGAHSQGCTTTRQGTAPAHGRSAVVRMMPAVVADLGFGAGHRLRTRAPRCWASRPSR